LTRKNILLFVQKIFHLFFRNSIKSSFVSFHLIYYSGANVDPRILGSVIGSDSTLTFEVIPREIDDVGGGLARVNGKVRMVEGLVLPKEERIFIFLL